MHRKQSPLTQASPSGFNWQAKGRTLVAWSLFLLLGMAGCESNKLTEVLPERGEVPDHVLWDFTTTESDSGNLVWILRADKAFIFSKKKTVEANGINVDMYGEGQVLNSTLTADSAVIDRKSGNMTAIGNVFVISQDGYELKTSELNWDRERELFHTKAFVEVLEGRNILTGYDMDCDQKLERLHIRVEPRCIIAQ